MHKSLSSSCDHQINAAIKDMETAKTGSALNSAQNTALAFIQAGFEAEKISKKAKQSLEKKVRQIYRSQMIEESV